MEGDQPQEQWVLPEFMVRDVAAQQHPGVLPKFGMRRPLEALARRSDLC